MEEYDDLGDLLQTFVTETSKNISAITEILSIRRGFINIFLSLYFVCFLVDEHCDESINLTSQQLQFIKVQLDNISSYLSKEEQEMQAAQVSPIYLNSFKLNNASVCVYRMFLKSWKGQNIVCTKWLTQS